MKTLIAVNNPDLNKMIFEGAVTKRLESFSEVHWLNDYNILSDVIGDYDACITSWGSPRFTPDIIARAEKLKFIGHGAGTVVPYMDEMVFTKGIIIVNGNYALSRATAEGAVAMMAAGSYKLLDYNKILLGGGWSNNNAESVLGLYHQTIGLIGYGDISKEVIRLLKPYEANILLYSDHCSLEAATKMGVKLCTLETLLKNANIISLHNTLTAKTKGMIGEAELGMMKEGALLLNTARAAIIEEKALVETMETGRINAILDVYETEPLPEAHPFRKLPNVWLLPHMAAYSGYWKKRLGLCVVEDLERFLKREALHGEITLEKYRRMTPC